MCVPVSGPLTRWCASTLGAALLCSSRVGSWFGACKRHMSTGALLSSQHQNKRHSYHHFASVYLFGLIKHSLYGQQNKNRLYISWEILHNAIDHSATTAGLNNNLCEDEFVQLNDNARATKMNFFKLQRCDMEKNFLLTYDVLTL